MMPNACDDDYVSRFRDAVRRYQSAALSQRAILQNRAGVGWVPETLKARLILVLVTRFLLLRVAIIYGRNVSWTPVS